MSEWLLDDYETEHYRVALWTDGGDLTLKGQANRVPPKEAARDLREIADWIEKRSANTVTGSARRG